MLKNCLPPRIVTSAAILVGNTLCPLFLRLRIRIVPKIIPNNFETHDSLAFLLHCASDPTFSSFSKTAGMVRWAQSAIITLWAERLFWHLLEMARTHTHTHT